MNFFNSNYLFEKAFQQKFLEINTIKQKYIKKIKILNKNILIQKNKINNSNFDFLIFNELIKLKNHYQYLIDNENFKIKILNLLKNDIKNLEKFKAFPCSIYK